MLIPDEFASLKQNVSFRFKNLDYSEAMQLMGKVGGINILVGDEVAGSISADLSNVPWDKAFNALLDMKNFAADIDVSSEQGSQDALAIIDQAITEVATVRGELGAFQTNTLESNLTSLQVASENMTSAESTLRDTDMAQELATFTRNQIMSQSATAQLAQANALPQNVLRLLNS